MNSDARWGWLLTLLLLAGCTKNEDYLNVFREHRTALKEMADILATVKDEKSMDMDFARANHALALAHRAEAAESWTRKDYNKAGSDLKAAARDLESAASWAGAKAKAGASGAVADTEALGDKLATGATWTSDEVGQGFDVLGHALDKLGHKIGAK